MKYLEVLKKDEILAATIKEALIIKKQKSDLYLHLLKAIASQQLSIKAAATIWGRFEKLFPTNYPFTNELLSLDN